MDEYIPKEVEVNRLDEDGEDIGMSSSWIEDYVLETPVKEEDNLHFDHYDPLNKLSCKKCKADTFEVINGFCYTGIRCKNCKYEFLIHEG